MTVVVWYQLVYLDGQLSSTVTYHGLKTAAITVHLVLTRSSSFTDSTIATTIRNLSPSITSATVNGSNVVFLENPDSLGGKVFNDERLGSKSETSQALRRADLTNSPRDD
ncbi:hypothetical protein BX666DRAFT_2123802 [Dichotomocladium elegans]|nr:hypothetical protein BX666DRAFT_2123802 [Dichotomocladium elegans]